MGAYVNKKGEEVVKYQCFELSSKGHLENTEDVSLLSSTSCFPVTSEQRTLPSQIHPERAHQGPEFRITEDSTVGQRPDLSQNFIRGDMSDKCYQLRLQAC